jgi:hypothetical protein
MLESRTVKDRCVHRRVCMDKFGKPCPIFFIAQSTKTLALKACQC